MRYLGVDIGSSGSKAAVFDGDGRPVAQAYREYQPLFLPDEGAELNSDEVLEACCAVIAEAAAAAGGPVRGVGISSQGEAFTPLGRDGRALANGMISSDARAAAYARDWSRAFGVDKLYRITGHTAHPMFSLFKLLWLKEHRPEVFSKAWKFLCFEDLLQHRLGLDPALGWPLAGRTMLFDVTRHAWSAEILAAVGLRPDQLARPLASGSVAGRIPAAVARGLGLPPDTPVVAGGHDQVCSALGAGVTEPGRAGYATGTVECITPAFDRAVFAPALQAANLCTYDHAVRGLYATVAFSLTGGNLLRWVRDEFGQRERDEAARGGASAYELLLRQIGDQPAGLLVLPYFTPSGTPYFDTETKGAILGLRLSTTRGEFIRGLLEGVAFEMRLNLDILEQAGCRITELRATGGGAQSAAWNQLKADVIGKPLAALNVTEAGCLGAALLACAADTGAPVRELAARWIRPAAIVPPRAEHAAWYAQRFALYRELHPRLRALRV